MCTIAIVNPEFKVQEYPISTMFLLLIDQTIEKTVLNWE